MVTSFLATAVMMTLCGFLPCGGVLRRPQAWVMMCRDQGRLEHHVPQGTATTGDGPFTAKGSAVVRDWGQPSECDGLFAGDGADLGISAISLVLATKRSRNGTKDDGGLRQAVRSLATARAIRSSSSLIRMSNRPLNSVSTSSNIAAVSSFLCARIWASSRLRISTSWALFDVKALRKRIFSVGRLWPASGRKARKRAMSSASIRSVLARVPRALYKRLHLSGATWRATHLLSPEAPRAAILGRQSTRSRRRHPGSGQDPPRHYALSGRLPLCSDTHRGGNECQASRG